MNNLQAEDRWVGFADQVRQAISDLREERGDTPLPEGRDSRDGQHCAQPTSGGGCGSGRHRPLTTDDTHTPCVRCRVAIRNDLITGGWCSHCLPYRETATA